MSRTKRKTKSDFERRQSKRLRAQKSKRNRHKEEVALSKLIGFSNRRPEMKQLNAAFYAGEKD